jgi:hypothetical protein
MLSIVLLTPPIAASAAPPCLFGTFKVFLKFGALEERSYFEMLWLQISKTLREIKNVVRELRRCVERVYMFSCLVIHINLDRISIFTPAARYILQPQFAHLVTCVV